MIAVNVLQCVRVPFDLRGVALKSVISPSRVSPVMGVYQDAVVSRAREGGHHRRDHQISRHFCSFEPVSEAQPKHFQAILPFSSMKSIADSVFLFEKNYPQTFFLSFPGVAHQVKSLPQAFAQVSDVV